MFIKVGETENGFTLIETLIYIALFGMILTGVIVSAYPLFTNTERSMASVTDEGEAAFILRKFSWAFNSAVGVSGFSSTGFTVTHVDEGDLEFTYDVDNNSLLMNGVQLNASRTSISLFSAELSEEGDYVEIDFKVGERQVGPINYYLHF